MSSSPPPATTSPPSTTNQPSFSRSTSGSGSSYDEDWKDDNDMQLMALPTLTMHGDGREHHHEHDSSQHGVAYSPTKTEASHGPLVRVSDVHHSTTSVVPAGEEESDFTSDKRFPLAFFAICLNVAMFALDQFIVVTAVPEIISEFEATDKLAFINSGFFIPCVGFVCFFTQLMTIFTPKHVFLAATVVFMVGMAVCGAAHSMDMLIIGRAIAGLGGSGLFGAAYIISAQLVPIHKRSGFYGLLGISYIVASIMGPLVGGAFTTMSRTGWRWCFYINLPVGAVVLLMLVVGLPAGRQLPRFDGKAHERSVWRQLATLDWVSTVLLLGATSCFTISLQWAGVQKEWKDPAVIGLLAAAPVCIIGWIGWSAWLGPSAQVPLSMLRSQHLWGSCMTSFFGYGAVVVILYYLPLYFEAVKGTTAVRAGVLLLALQCTMCVVLIVTGKLGERTGHLWPTMPVGTALVVIGSGLLTTVHADTALEVIIGFQVVIGFGLGLFMAVMTVLMQAKYWDRPTLVPVATGIQNLSGFIGRILSITVASSIFNNIVLGKLVAIEGLPEVLAQAVAASPAAIKDKVPESLQVAVKTAYADSIHLVWWVCVSFGVCAFVSVMFLRRHNLKSIETTIAARAAGRDAERDGDRAAAAGAFEMHLSPAGASASVMTLAGAGVGTGMAEDDKKTQSY